MKTIALGMEGMTLDDLARIARQGVGIVLTPGAEERIGRAWQLVTRWVDEERTVYGVTTGFGALSDVTISKSDTRQLQFNILKSHAVGVGQPLASDIVRAMMALRVKDFARGNAGVRTETAAAWIRLLNAGMVPVVPEKGSVGASGDLVPLAHVGLVLIGEGEAFFDGRRISGREALEICGLAPLKLEAGEGLAMINGTPGHDRHRRAGSLRCGAPGASHGSGCRHESRSPDGGARPNSIPAFIRCAPIRGRPSRPKTWIASRAAVKSSLPTGIASVFRTPTRCAVRPRSMVPAAMLSPMPRQCWKPR